MMESGDRVIQTGDNKFYPKEGVLWKYGTPPPEWLSDMVKVEKVTESGIIILAEEKSTNRTKNLIKTSGGLITLPDEGSYIIYSTGGRVITVTEKQLWYLYQKK